MEQDLRYMHVYVWTIVHTCSFSWTVGSCQALRVQVIYWLIVVKIVWTKKFAILGALLWLRAAPESTEVLI